MKASDLLVKALEREGVEYIFGIPGEENLDLLESLRESSIRLIVTRHEQAAGFMAATYGRLTGKAGVCLSTLSPGATNLVTAAAYANLGAMPMVMLTGQKPIKSRLQGRFQMMDVVVGDVSGEPMQHLVHLHIAAAAKGCVHIAPAILLSEGGRREVVLCIEEIGPETQGDYRRHNKTQEECRPTQGQYDSDGHADV